MMRRTVIVAVLAVFGLFGCSEDVNQPQRSGPDVLLSDEFDSLNSQKWQLIDACDGLSKPDDQGNFTLMSCDYPGWATSSLSSKQEWMIEDGKTYTATLRIGTPDCVSWAANLSWGLDCYRRNVFLGRIGFDAVLADVRQVFVEFRKPFGPCNGQSEQGTDVCGEFHDYVLVVSDTKIEAYIDDVIQSRIDLVDECGRQIDSFKIHASVSTFRAQNKVLIDKITLKRANEK